MKTFAFRTLFIAALAAVAITVACGGDEDNDMPDAGSAAGGGTMPVTQALLDSLPPYEGATLVREWIADGGRVQVREYAVDAEPQEAVDSVTNHFRDALLADGWEEQGFNASASFFIKEGRRIVIGRIGPELQEPASGVTMLNSAEAPASSGFFFTVEAEESFTD
jgi:hypothetical protein